jgi:arsenate reductase (thioredoxin)
MSPITVGADIDRPAHDVVITMGCGDTCPIYRGTRYKDWTLADPAGQPIDVVREIRDEIRQRLEHLITELVSAKTPTA